jgi:HK97 family phage prohead protease
VRGEGTRSIGGYAAKFNKLSQNLGGFVERIDPAFFNKSAADGWPGVLARYNHDDNMLLGTTTGGTLRLSLDGVGLVYEVDPPSHRSDVVELVGRGDVRQSSFAFQIGSDGDDWGMTDSGFPMRTLLTGRLMDVAPVNSPAYLDTSTGLRSLAVRFDVDLEEVAQAAQAGELRKFFGGPAPKVYDLGQSQRDSVTDAEWHGDPAKYSPEEWKRACLIDTGEGDPDSKSRYKLPVRTPDGTLSRPGCHAAAAALVGARGGVDATPEQKKTAAEKLVSLYKNELDETPPQSLTDLATRAEYDVSEVRQIVSGMTPEAQGSVIQVLELLCASDGIADVAKYLLSELLSAQSPDIEDPEDSGTPTQSDGQSETHPPLSVTQRMHELLRIRNSPMEQGETHS